MTNATRFLLPLLFLAGPALAETSDTSSDVPYPVTGSTAPAIYENIKTGAPRVAPNATFAFTAIATKTIKSHAVEAGECRYKRFQTKAIYNFVLPEHQNTASLGKRLAKTWAEFAAYLKTHEEGHRRFNLNHRRGLILGDLKVGHQRRQSHAQNGRHHHQPTPAPQNPGVVTNVEVAAIALDGRRLAAQRENRV